MRGDEGQGSEGQGGAIAGPRRVRLLSGVSIGRAGRAIDVRCAGERGARSPISLAPDGRPHQPFSSQLCGVNADPASGKCSSPTRCRSQREDRPAIDVFDSLGSFIAGSTNWQSAGKRRRILHPPRSLQHAVNDTSHRVYVATTAKAKASKKAKKEAVFVYSALREDSFLTKGSRSRLNTPRKRSRLSASSKPSKPGAPALAVAQPSQGALRGRHGTTRDR